MAPRWLATYVAAAITQMLVPRAAALDAMSAWQAAAAPITGGVRLTVTAECAGDAATVAKIRGLGFAGLLIHGDHHTAHHLLIAKGQTRPRRAVTGRVIDSPAAARASSTRC